MKITQERRSSIRYKKRTAHQDSFRFAITHVYFQSLKLTRNSYMTCFKTNEYFFNAMFQNFHIKLLSCIHFLEHTIDNHTRGLKNTHSRNEKTSHAQTDTVQIPFSTKPRKRKAVEY